MDDMMKNPEEGGWKLIGIRRRSKKVTMTQEGTADATRWRGLEVKEVGMTEETKTKSEAGY